MSQHAFCPHCNAKLKFKKLPQKTLDCPKCQQPIEPAHFQSAVEEAAAPVEAVPAADPIPPQSSDEDEVETYSFSAPAPKAAPATSPVDDDLAERIERQIKPKKKKQRRSEDEEEEQEDSWLKTGLLGLFGSAWFLIYGGMGGGVTFLKIIDISAGFIFWTGVVLAGFSLLAVAYGIYEVFTEGFAEALGDDSFPKKAGITLLLVGGLVYLVFRESRNNDSSPEDPENGPVASADSTYANQHSPTNEPSRNTDNSASRNNRHTQVADEEPEPAPEITILLRADRQIQDLVDFAALLKPREKNASAETTRQTPDYMMIKLSPVPDLNLFAKNIELLGFHPRNIDKDNRVVEFDPPSFESYNPSGSSLVINPSIFKNLPGIPYTAMRTLNREYRGADFTPLVGYSFHQFETPNLVGETEHIIRGGRCRTNAMYGKLCFDEIVFAAFPQTGEPKDRRLRTGEIQEKRFGAKEGYVMTGLNVAYDEIPRGIQPLFTRYKEGIVDPSDSYVGEWIGLHDDHETTMLGGHEQPVLGIICFGESSVAGVALILQPIANTD